MPIPTSQPGSSAPRYARAAVRIVGAVAGLAALLGGPASAQEASRPLTFSVKPSGVENETPEERLERRLKQREFLFRSICIHCGPGDRFRSNAPFRPFDALARPKAEQD